MAANFPTTLPAIARVLPTDYMNDVGKEADLLHNEIADEIEALAAAVGVTGSIVPGTVEARLASAVTFNNDPVTGVNDLGNIPTNQLYKATRRATMAVVGDSFAAYSGLVLDPAGWSGVYYSNKPMTWVRAMLGVRFDFIYYSGASGTPPSTWITNGSVDSAIATHPDYLFITGDADGGATSVADFTAAYAEIFRRANVAGVMCIAHTIPPNNTLASAGARTNVQKYNEWLTNVAASLYNVIVINVTGASLDRTSNLYVPDLTVTDGVHWGRGGAFGAGALMAKVLDTIIPVGPPVPWIEMYEDDGTKRHGVIKSPLNTGTGGSISILTTSTGIPDGKVVSASAGQSGTCNTSARLDGEPGNWLDFDVTFTAVDKYARSYELNAGRLGGLVAGTDSIEFFAEIKLDESTLAVVKFPYFYVEFSGLTNIYLASIAPTPSSTYAVGSTMVKNTYTAGVLTLSTGRVLIPAGATAYNIYCGVQSASSGNCKFSIGRIGFS